MRPTLTTKQYETLVLLADHLTSKEIARLLKISPSAVDQRIVNAMRRLGVRSRRDAARVVQNCIVCVEAAAGKG